MPGELQEAAEPAPHAARAPHDQHPLAALLAQRDPHPVLPLDRAADDRLEHLGHHLLRDSAGLGMLAGAAEHPVLDVLHHHGEVRGGLDAPHLGGEIHAAAQQLQQGAVHLGDGIPQGGERIG